MRTYVGHCPDYLNSLFLAEPANVGVRISTNDCKRCIWTAASHLRPNELCKPADCVDVRWVIERPNKDTTPGPAFVVSRLEIVQIDAVGNCIRVVVWKDA